MRKTTGNETGTRRCFHVWARALAALLCLTLLTACAGDPGVTRETEQPSSSVPAFSETPSGETLPPGSAEPAPTGTADGSEDDGRPLVPDTIYYRAYGFDEAPDLYSGQYSNFRETDHVISTLIDDYDVISTDQHGRYVVNRSVCEAMEDRENEDGSHTVTVTLRKGLCYNNGEPITAVDYLVSALVSFSPVLNPEPDGYDQQTSGKTWASYFAGAEAYLAGESDTISGLKLLDDYRYSVTIPAEAVELYYNCANVSLRPLHVFSYGAGYELDGDQVRLVNFSYEGFRSGSTVNVGRVSAGPYQIVSFQEKMDGSDRQSSALQMVLSANKYYAGNFEGQKPQVETVVLTNYGWESNYADLPQDEASYFALSYSDFLPDFQPYLDEGHLCAVGYPSKRSGCLYFQSDIGPARFPAVHKALACLIDREGYAEEYCLGWGTVIHGPYDTSRWEYRENAAELEEQLDPYAYDPARAVKLLEEDGWVLAEDGSPYVSGLRYKQLTPEEAGDYADVTELSDGRILMPLRLHYMDADMNPNEVKEKYLFENQAMTDAGMQIVPETMSFDDLLNYLYRDEAALAEHEMGPNIYCLCTLATILKPKYDFTEDFAEASDLYHVDRNGRLAQLSRQMLQARDDAAFADLWKDFVLTWNDELPSLPLYQTIQYDLMDSRIHGLTPNAYWPFERAVLYATVETGEAP